MKSKLLSKVLEIASVLETGTSNRVGLMDGDSGEILFFAYLYRCTGNTKYLETCQLKLNNIINSIDSKNVDFSLCSGISGVAWTISHLRELDLLEEEDYKRLNDLNNVLIEIADYYFTIGNWDYLHGGIGIIEYFLDLKDNKFVQKSLEKCVLSLTDLAEYLDDGGIRWSVYNNSNLDLKFSLGLSHGIPSIIKVLYGCYQQNILKEQSKLLLDGALKYLMSNANFNEELSVFPSFDCFPFKQTRLSWCYGDLSIAILLINISQGLENKEIEMIAHEIAVSCTKRLDKEGIVDASFCHGSSGICFMYHLLYTSTKKNEFKEMSVYWLEYTLNLGQNENGLAGFNYYLHPNWIQDRSLLEGIAGIGLVILSLSNEKSNSEWKKFFLIS